jgi:hypothetical protein
VALLALGTLYALVFLLPGYLRERARRPTRQLLNIRTTLEESNIIISGYRDAANTGPEVSVALDNLTNEWQTNITDLEKAKDSLNPTKEREMIDALQKIIDSNKTILQEYEVRYKILSKPIAYSPKSDLEPLQMPHNRDDFISRSNQAANALQQIGSHGPYPLDQSNNAELTLRTGKVMILDDLTRGLLTSQVSCFKELADKASSQNNTVIDAVRKTCIGSYEVLRRKLVIALTDTFRSDEASNLTTQTTELISRIDTRTKPSRE